MTTVGSLLLSITHSQDRNGFTSIYRHQIMFDTVTLSDDTDLKPLMTTLSLMTL